MGRAAGVSTRNLSFSTAYHTRFPEYPAARAPRALASFVRVAVYAVLSRFHAPASAVMVATESIEQELKTRKIRRLVRWSRGVDTNLFRPYGKDLSDFSTFPRPILLYVGRVAVEKNLRAFLDIDTVGSQIVVGDGPDLASLKREYPDVHFLGALSGEKLACHYAAADLFVFPSIVDTFGLVSLEACAAGLRVAAMPAPGPSDIFADDTAKDFAAMDWDLGRDDHFPPLGSKPLSSVKGDSIPPNSEVRRGVSDDRAFLAGTKSTGRKHQLRMRQ